NAAVTVQFIAAPLMSLEEAVAIYYDSATGTIKRTTSTNMTNPSNPAWAPANEFVPSALSLQFAYFDATGNPIIPDSLANRTLVARVDIKMAVQTVQSLANGSWPVFS